MICPKCGHERTNKDDPLIPDYQCPACGIVYAKFKSQGQQMSSTVSISDKSTKQDRPAYSHINTDQPNGAINREIVKPLFTNRLKIIAICGLVLVVMAKSYMSPSAFMEDFRNALFNQDASDLTEYIDFEKLRTNTKASIKSKISQPEDQDNNPFFKIGAVWGGQLIDAMIDKTITPEGIKAAFNSQLKGDEEKNGAPVFDFHYANFNKVSVNLSNGTVVKLDRKGYFSWVIVAIDADQETIISNPISSNNTKKQETNISIDTSNIRQQNITAALDLFKLDTGRYPSTEEGLQALVVPPYGLKWWKGPYIPIASASYLSEYNYHCCPRTIEKANR